MLVPTVGGFRDAGNEHVLLGRASAAGPNQPKNAHHGAAMAVVATFSMGARPLARSRAAVAPQSRGAALLFGCDALSSFADSDAPFSSQPTRS